MAKFRLVVALVVSGLVFTFVVQNWEAVPLRFLFWSFEVPRLLLVLMLLLFGFLLGIVYATFSHPENDDA